MKPKIHLIYKEKDLDYALCLQIVLQLERLLEKIRIRFLIWVGSYSAILSLLFTCSDLGPDFQKILSQTYDKILVKIMLRHS